MLVIADGHLWNASTITSMARRTARLASGGSRLGEHEIIQSALEAVCGALALVKT
jgi:hypothetical protein